MSIPTQTNSLSSSQEQWQQGQLVEIEITDLSDSGSGVGRVAGRVVFVPNTVTGDRVLVRLVRTKQDYGEGKLQEILSPSPHRIRPSCIVADKCGGCQWQQVSYEHQLLAKQNQVIQALERLGGFSQPPVGDILGATHPLGYRNKVTYPLARSSTGQVQAGYYRQGSHQLVNLNQCPIQDSRLNPLLAQIKQDIQARGWSIYNEQRNQGRLRHLSLRIGRNTGEILLTLVSTDWSLGGLEEQAGTWLTRYPELVGVCLNRNPKPGNVIFGEETRCIAGQPYLTERFAGIEFQLRPTTFFQVNTEIAEALLGVIINRLELQGNETIVDAYCGIGTLTLPLAQRVKAAIAIESNDISVEQAQVNAQINGVTNTEFLTGTVETLLPQLRVIPDVILLDPPRKGCDRSVINTLLAQQPARIVYMSCKPATLARDLKQLCQGGNYRLTYVQPADFFPQTAHVESAAFLERV